MNGILVILPSAHTGTHTHLIAGMFEVSSADRVVRQGTNTDLVTLNTAAFTYLMNNLATLEKGKRLTLS